MKPLPWNEPRLAQQSPSSFSIGQHSHVEAIGFLILGIFLIICSVECYIFLHLQGARAESSQQDLIYSLGPASNPSYYALSSSMTHRVSFSKIPDPIVMLARHGSVEIGIVSQASSAASSKISEDIMRVADGVQLTHDGMPKSAVTISGEGRYISYSVLNADATSTTRSVAPSLIGDWNVAVLDSETGSSTTYGTGYGGQVVERAGTAYLFYTDENGIRILDLSKKTAQHLQFLVGSSTAAYSRVSTDGTYLAYFNPILDEYDAFGLSLDSKGMWAAIPLGRLAPHSSVAAFAGPTLYEISVSSSTPALYSYNLGKELQATKVYSFPKGLSILQLIP